MGLSKDSTGRNAVDAGLAVRKVSDDDMVVALAGNPNVGKSTVFNALTGLRQHTGNWPGKTVCGAQGYCTYGQKGYVMVDLPGCYSLIAHSAEEEVARDFLCFGGADAVIVVCDATCLERSLNLALQTMELHPNVILCVNLMDEAKRKGIAVDLDALSRRIGAPVVGTSARSGKGLGELMRTVARTVGSPQGGKQKPVVYPGYLEAAVARLEPHVKRIEACAGRSRWFSLMLLHDDPSTRKLPEPTVWDAILSDSEVASALIGVKEDFARFDITERRVRDDIVSSLVSAAEEISGHVLAAGQVPADGQTPHISASGRKASHVDNILTGKRTAFPVMLLALLGVFWLTITGANYPSRIISEFLFGLEPHLFSLLTWMHVPGLLSEMLILGMYRVLAWVVSVMLPPMAIFFPLFTLLEDVGFLPRVAFNLDKCFKSCRACGKQALTMCMG